MHERIPVIFTLWCTCTYVCTTQCGKMKKNTVTQTFFRQINYLVFSLFIWHSVEKYTKTTVWKNEKFSLTGKKFRQINYLVFSLVKQLVSRIFCEKLLERISAISTLWHRYLGLDRLNYKLIWRNFLEKKLKSNLMREELYSKIFREIEIIVGHHWV